MGKKKEIKFKLWEVMVIVSVSVIFMSVFTGFIVYKKFNSGTVSTTNNKYVNELIKGLFEVILLVRFPKVTHFSGCANVVIFYEE